MNKNIRNILKEKIVRINLSREEINKKILKSISQNNNINNNIKIYTNYFLNKTTKKNHFLSKKHKICLYTGKRGGLFKGFNFSRYIIKSLILQNKYTNLKKNNW
jgi:hypothetical protein